MALEELNRLETLKHFQWVDASTIFLQKDGSFSLDVINKAPFRAHIKRASLFIINLFPSRRPKAPEEEEEEQQQQQRLHARRLLLVSLLGHAWLWERPRVLNSQGNVVDFKERRVLAPTEILKFLCKADYTYQEVYNFLDKVQEVSLHQDSSRWNAKAVIACLRWDRMHDIYGEEGPWCSCRLEKERHYHLTTKLA